MSVARTFRLRQFRCLWGMIHQTDGHLARSPHAGLDTFLPAVKALGYEGVEAPLKIALLEPDWKQRMDDNGLKSAFVIFTDGPVAPGGEVPGAGGWLGTAIPGFSRPTQPGASDKAAIVEQHTQVFKEQVEAAAAYDPAYVNSHSIKDYFTVSMAESFFSKALAFDPTVMHEGHRKRYLHSPWVARELVPKFPELRLVADLSHWINVAETDTKDIDLTKVIEDVAPQVYHTHCRVGYDHGPQVPDPRAPEWIPYMEGHERWWDAIWAAQQARGDTATTMIAEHGPPNYQQTLPHSREPVASIWDVNHWVSLRRQVRFGELYGVENTSNLIPSATQGFEPTTTPGPSILHGLTGDISFRGA
eukprot:gnl/TRDRNA2_/TRDRNA2_83423_c0_seq1.p1 gnl/TRDRNA2_/TRDRNA2_83423_c0~~gnl/TRDRNA2_/TRDRNA2_83423_c0_seq1.p1  ORF type:complete len:373 (+),score=49.41 gnl/TRDRNA2_/TRDRNA2_83423_c0_seq1:42-1121(+)